MTGPLNLSAFFCPLPSFTVTAGGERSRCPSVCLIGVPADTPTNSSFCRQIPRGDSSPITLLEHTVKLLLIGRCARCDPRPDVLLVSLFSDGQLFERRFIFYLKCRPEPFTRSSNAGEGQNRRLGEPRCDQNAPPLSTANVFLCRPAAVRTNVRSTSLFGPTQSITISGLL
jgi:hypothetical protein